MKIPSRHVLFLNSRYKKSNNAFHLKLLKGSYHIAVDGGIRFFLKNNIQPDVLIGDFDSAPRMSAKYLSGFEIVRHPSHKDKTDSQLAVELALERGAGEIEICGGLGSTEIDHTLGNIFLLDIVNKHSRKQNKNVKARLINSSNSVYLVDNDFILLRAAVGDYLSVIPMSEFVALDFTGLVYPPPKRRLKFGDTLSLRNQFKHDRCRLHIRGKAIVVVIKKK